MPRNYRNISMYEKEIIDIKRKGCTGKEICAKYGFKLKRYKNFITRYNKKQEKLSSAIAILKKGRLAKDTVVTK